MFLTSIPTDFADMWLENLLMTAGPLVSMRRVRDANGIAKGFGFAEYGDLESVLRCLKCINGLKLPSKNGEQALSVRYTLICLDLDLLLTPSTDQSRCQNNWKPARI